MDEALLERLFRAIDAKDIASFVDCLTDDGSFRFGSAQAVRGRESIAAQVGGFFDSLAGLEHMIGRTIRDGDTLVVEGDVTYTRHDRRRVTLPFVNVLELQGECIDDYRIYADLSPLYSD